MNCTVYMMSCNFATHAICPLKIIMYKYNELQMFVATQKLRCKVSCKTSFFLIMIFDNLACVFANAMVLFVDLCDQETIASKLITFGTNGVILFQGIKTSVIV